MAYSLVRSSTWPLREYPLTHSGSSAMHLSASVPGVPALRANFEVLQMARNLAVFVEAILNPLHRSTATPLEFSEYIMPPLGQPIDHAVQNIQGDIVTIHDPSRRDRPGGLPHMPSLAGVWKICIHADGESQARPSMVKLGGLAAPFNRPPLATRDTAP